MLVQEIRKPTADKKSSLVSGPVLTVDVRKVYDTVTNVIRGTPTVDLLGTQFVQASILGNPIVTFRQDIGEVFMVTAR